MLCVLKLESWMESTTNIDMKFHPWASTERATSNWFSDRFECPLFILKLTSVPHCVRVSVFPLPFDQSTILTNEAKVLHFDTFQNQKIFIKLEKCQTYFNGICIKNNKQWRSIPVDSFSTWALTPKKFFALYFHNNNNQFETISYLKFDLNVICCTALTIDDMGEKE